MIHNTLFRHISTQIVIKLEIAREIGAVAKLSPSKCWDGRCYD